MLRWLVEHCLRATFPSTSALPGLDRLDYGAGLDDVLRGAPLLRLGLYASTLAFIASPLLTLGLPLPSFLLTDRLIDRHVNALSSSRFYLLRQSILMVKTVGGLLWGGHSEVRAKLGLPPLPADTGGFRGDQLRDVAATTTTGAPR